MHWRDPKPDKPGCYMHNHRRSAVAQLRTTVRGGGHHIYTFLFSSVLSSTTSAPPPPLPHGVFVANVCFFHSAPFPLLNTPLSPCCCLPVSSPGSPTALTSSSSYPLIAYPPIPTPFFHQFSSLSSSIYFVPVLRFFHFPLFFAYSSYVRFVSHFSNGLVLFYLFILSQ